MTKSNSGAQFRVSGFVVSRKVWKRHMLRVLRQRDGDRCYFCQGQLLFAEQHQNSKKFVTIDHKIPTGRGGSNDEDNLCLACFTCNNLKGHRTADEFLKDMAEKLGAKLQQPATNETIPPEPSLDRVLVPCLNNDTDKRQREE